MMLPFLLLAAVMVLGLASLAAWKRHADRQAELPRVARRAGLSFSEGDAFDSARVPFQLFRQGDGHEVTNTMWGRAPDGAPVRAFDFSYYVESNNGRVGTSGLGTTGLDTSGLGLTGVLVGGGRVEQPTRRYRHFTCALTEVPAVWPHLVITPQKGLTRLINVIVGDDIDFESGEFNRMFRITCEDRHFAQTFIDAQMIDFLLTTKGEFQVEVRGRWVLVSTGQLPPRGFPGLMNLSNALRAVIPPLVWELYPQGPRASLDGGMV